MLSGSAACQGGGGSTASPQFCAANAETSRSTACSGRQNAATRRNMRREDRVTVQGPIKKQQRDGMSHRKGWGGTVSPHFCAALSLQFEGALGQRSQGFEP